MIKDGESHAIIHKMDIVYMQVGVSGMLIECDACDRSHGSDDLWSITGFDCAIGPLTGGNIVVLCVGAKDLSLLRTIWLPSERCTMWFLCSGTWRQVIVNGIHQPLA